MYKSFKIIMSVMIILSLMAVGGTVYTIQKDRALLKENQPELILEVLPSVQLFMTLNEENIPGYLTKNIKDRTYGKYTTLQSNSNFDASEGLIELILNTGGISRYIDMPSDNKSYKELTKLINKMLKETNYENNHYDFAGYQNLVVQSKEKLGKKLHRYLKEELNKDWQCSEFVIIPNEYRTSLEVVELENTEEGQQHLVYVFYVHDLSQYKTFNFIEDFYKSYYREDMTALIKENTQLHNLYLPVAGTMEEHGVLHSDVFLTNMLAKTLTLNYIKDHYHEESYLAYKQVQVDEGYYFLEQSYTDFIPKLENNKDHDLVNLYSQELLSQMNKIIADYYRSK